jgi:P4 family phage/plasmid primase-like protien
MTQEYDSKDKEEKKTKSSKKFLDWAWQFLDKHPAVYHNGALLIYNGQAYKEEQEPEVAIGRFLANIKVNISAYDAKQIFFQIKLICKREDKFFPFWLDSAKDVSNLIPFKNGILDLKSFVQDEIVLQPHTKYFVSKYCLPFDFDHEAKCPIFQQTIHQCLEDDQQRINLLSEWFGYCLKADVSQQKLMLFYGLPGAGKSLLAEILRNLIGIENTCAFDLFRLLDRFSSVMLWNAQLAVVGEVEMANNPHRMRIIEKLKDITGNGAQPIERKGVDVTESAIFPARWLICSNQLPKLPDPTGALARRMLVIPFNKSFVGEADTNLASKLLEELPGIALWSLYGLQRLERQGWTIGSTSAGSTMEWRRQGQTWLAFLQDCCEVRKDWLSNLTPGITPTDDLECYTERKQLMRVFNYWAEVHCPSAHYNYFIQDARSVFKDMPIDKKKTNERSGVRYRVEMGIKIKPDVLSNVEVEGDLFYKF